VDLLEEAGGRLTPEDLAGAMGIKRSRNMRASVWYARLLDARVVERDSEGYLYLTADWLAAWDRRRVEDEEEMDRLRDQERYKRMSEAWALRVDEHAEGLHQRRLDREALACFDGEIPPEADGLIGELEPVEEGAHGPEDVPEGSEEVQEPVRTPVESSRRSGDGLSELARKLRVYLTLCPHRAHEKPSWLANYAWSESLVGWKPTPEEAAGALEELERCRFFGEAA
ncbi:MAG: hypothetical protein M3522_03255, partial [Actinomycetota bacterium]|nr:hypothetical protein [Actinomycetota bacterium]